MSQYINFFIRHESTFLPIGTYSRSSEIYQLLKDVVPYEHITVLKKEMLDNAYSRIQEMKNRTDKEISNLERRRDMIKSLESSIEDKLRVLDGLDESIKDNRDEYEEILFAENYLSFLFNMLSDVEYSENENLYPDSYLYAGIEIAKPTEVDIV